jgi:hypothetical protein
MLLCQVSTCFRIDSKVGCSDSFDKSTLPPSANRNAYLTRLS